MLNTLIALPYEIARKPLALVDSGLEDRLSDTALPKVVLDRALGRADKVAGSLLRNRQIAARGAERIDRTEKLLTAARLEKQAATERELARDTGRSGRQQATQLREAAEKRASKGLQEADVVEAAGKREARAEATRTASAKKAAATRKAEAREADVEKRTTQRTQTAEAKKKAAQRSASKKTAQAAQSRKAAAAQRADARELEQLTEAKKEQRTS
ncbi:MAG: hypothetical protein ACTHNS_08450 [Marmoricola sp.]